MLVFRLGEAPFTIFAVTYPGNGNPHGHNQSDVFAHSLRDFENSARQSFQLRRHRKGRRISPRSTPGCTSTQSIARTSLASRGGGGRQDRSSRRTRSGSALPPGNGRGQVQRTENTHGGVRIHFQEDGGKEPAFTRTEKTTKPALAVVTNTQKRG